MPLSFSPENKQRLAQLALRYPHVQALCLPALHLAQKQFGFISPETVALVAAELHLPAAHVHGVATFYSMYQQKKMGRFHLQVCTNISCLLCGAEKTMERLEALLGIKRGQITADGLFSLEEVECLAYCGSGPAVQVSNEEIFELVTAEKIEEMLDRLRATIRESNG